jgi:hypothetical protein
MGRQLQEQLQVIFGKRPIWLLEIEQDGDDFVVVDLDGTDIGTVTLQEKRVKRYRIFGREGSL